MKLSATGVLLGAIDTVVGRNTDVARYLTRAIKSNDALDLLLAQAAFDELDGEKKRAVVREIEARTASMKEANADPRRLKA